MLWSVALDYGLYRRQHFSDEKTVVAFVSVGHAAASVSIAAFTSAGGEVLSQVSNPDLGGRDLDRLIAEHFAKAFERQHGTNPMNSLKARLKSNTKHTAAYLFRYEGSNSFNLIDLFNYSIYLMYLG